MEDNDDQLNFEEAWDIIQEEGINKIIDTIETEGDHRQLFTSEQYMRIYTIVCDICQPESRTYGDAQSLYENYKKTLEDYISTKVLPSLQGKTNEVLLQELIKQWNNLKRLTVWLSKFFSQLDRYFIPRRALLSLKGTSYSIFCELVYEEINDKIRGGVLSLIKKDREGVDIDQAMVKNVLDIYIEMGEGSPKYFEKDFGESLLDNTASCEFNDDASMMSINDYIRKKVKECSSQNKDKIPPRNTNDGDKIPGYFKDTDGYKKFEFVDGKLTLVGRDHQKYEQLKKGN